MPAGMMSLPSSSGMIPDSRFGFCAIHWVSSVGRSAYWSISAKRRYTPGSLMPPSGRPCSTTLMKKSERPTR